MTSSLSAFYARSFAQHPWVTLGVTNGGLSLVADSLAQGLSSGAPASGVAPGYDALRGMRFLAFGAAMAPLLAEWNRFIELRFPLRSAAPALPSHVELRGVGEGVAKEVAAQGRVSLRALAKRVVVDQGAL
jgi:protein Mpv17